MKKPLKKFIASRPIAVHYPGGYVGHCKTLRNALVAATRRMLVDEIDDKATVYYQDEVVADVVRVGHKLQVMWRVKWAAQGSDLW